MGDGSVTYKKESIYDTGLPIIVVDSKKLFSKYPQIGYGEEGSIHQYDNKKAIKVFEFFEDRPKLTDKFKKIEQLARINDSSFCFPKGLVGYLDLKKEGYFMNLVKPMDNCHDFSELDRLKDLKKILEYILIADRAMARIHKKGIVIGDIRGENIMIDKCGEVKFIDTDNYKYGDYNYDIVPCRSTWLEHTFSKKVTDIDNDIFVFAIMALQYFIKGTNIKYRKSEVYFKQLIEYLNVSKEVKDGLSIILSDAPNKPYVGKILKKINLDEPLISDDKIMKLNGML